MIANQWNLFYKPPSEHEEKKVFMSAYKTAHAKVNVFSLDVIVSGSLSPVC